MFIKHLSYITLGLIFGYLNGLYLSFGNITVKLTLILLLMSFIFMFFKSKRDIVLRSICVIVMFLTLSFIIGSVRGYLIKVNFEKEMIYSSFHVKVLGFNQKDSVKILKTKVIDFENNSSDVYNKIKDKKILLYTFDQNSYVPDQIFKVEGKLLNSFIILPDKSDVSNTVRSFDLAEYWRSKGFEYIMLYPKISDTKNNESGHSFRYYTYVFREKFHNNLEKIMNNQNAGILSAMLWGDETKISKEVYNKYTLAGVSHILVLSGYNLAILVAGILFIFKRQSIKTKVFLSLLAVSCFIILADSDVTLWRAGIMVLYSLGAMYFLKPENGKISVWLAVFVFTVLSPMSILKDVSLQLSILATMSIVYFYPVLSSILIKDKKFTYVDNIKEAVVLTFSANILLMPFLVYSFGYLKLSGLFLSIVLSFFIPFIMFFGFLGGFTAFISLFLGKVFVLIANILIVLMNFLVNTFYNISPIVRNGFDFSTLVLIYTILFFIYKYLEFYDYNKKYVKE